MDGEEGGTWSRTFELCDTWFPDPNGRRTTSRFATDGLNRTILPRCGLTAPVLPELRADVRDHLLVISEPVSSKKILAIQMQVPFHGWEEGELGHVFEKQKTTVVSALPNRYC
jgi:hypothetical protein